MTPLMVKPLDTVSSNIDDMLWHNLRHQHQHHAAIRRLNDLQVLLRADGPVVLGRELQNMHRAKVKGIPVIHE